MQLNKITNIFIALFIYTTSCVAQTYLPCGHSHNDYLQQHPLYDAVKLGFGSIEIDVCMDKNKELKVAHNPWFLTNKKNIDELYFAPIAKMVDEKDSIFKYSPEHPLQLLIDFKKNADSTYKYLKVVFGKYSKYITQYKNGKVIYKAPLIIHITGNKPWKAMLEDTVLFARMDGPLILTDLTLSSPGLASMDTAYLKLMGRASAPYKNLINFRNRFKNEDEFYRNVNANIKVYNEYGITIRYYAMPNKEVTWRFILKCGLHWVNVDKLNMFSKFYKAYVLDKASH